MIDLILLTKATEKIGIAVENDLVLELAIDRPDMPELVGTIILGKVITVDHGLQAAFIEIGQKKLAYLEKKQIPLARKDRKKPIESFLYEGESIIVQVTKDAYEEKGAQLTMNVTIANQMLVYLPYGDYLAVSKKLSQDVGKRLRADLKGSIKGEEGLIIRTQATDYSTDELIHQIEQARNSWEEILAVKKHKIAPEILRVDHTVTDRFIRRFPFDKIDRIICDQVAATKQIKAHYPGLESKTKWVRQAEAYLPLSLEQLNNKLLHPVVESEQGVQIVINQTEAMTVIDVNSSGFTGRVNRHQFAYKVNRIAAKTIQQQIRLRNLSGMIVIDFLRMKDHKSKQGIINQLNESFENDPNRTEVYGFTSLGLLELTRKRDTRMHHQTYYDREIQKKPLSPISLVYQLERKLISSTSQATIVEVTKGFRNLWNQWIDDDQFKDNASGEIYFIETKGIDNYHIKRSGSDQLISEYFTENKQLKVDRVN